MVHGTTYDLETHMWSRSRRPKAAVSWPPMVFVQRQSLRAHPPVYLRWSLPVSAATLTPYVPNLFSARWTEITSIK